MPLARWRPPGGTPTRLPLDEMMGSPPTIARNPLRVLMVVASEDDGGMARVVALLARNLPAFDVHVTVAVHREAPLTEWLGASGIVCHLVPELIETPARRRDDGRTGVRALAANVLGLPRAVRRLRAIAEGDRADVLYSHNTWGHYVAAATARRIRTANRAIGLVWHVHNDHSRPLTRAFDRLAIRAGRVSGVAAVSESIGQPFAGLSPRLAIVTNGIDLAACEAASRCPQLRTRLALPPDAIVVVYAGRLVAHKGIHVLLEAGRQAIGAMPTLHLVVLGGNPRHEARNVLGEMSAQITAWGLEDRIHLLGHVAGTEPYLADADIATVPSICADGFPLAAVEALCLGVPVIATSTGGLLEMVRPGLDGVLVPPGDAEALARAMVTLARDSDCRQRMSREARAAARSRFDGTEMTRRVAALLHSARPAHAV